jgi:hypothetical protein
MSDFTRESLKAMIDKHRDPAFLARLAERMEQDEALLKRMSGSGRESLCMIGQGFSDACQRAAKYSAHWTDNGDEGLLCELHAAVARALPNGSALHLKTLSEEI